MMLSGKHYENVAAKNGGPPESNPITWFEAKYSIR